MELQRETFIIGGKEYSAGKIPAFAANSIILKLKNIVLPVIGELSSKQGSLLDMDLSGAFNILAEKLDEKVMSDIILPMFSLAQVASITDNTKIDSQKTIDQVFTVDNLADLYELIYEVLRYNFQPFFVSAMSRFGTKNGSQAVTA